MGEGKGISGLESMVSDVSGIIDAPSQSKSSAPNTNAGRPDQPARQSSEPTANGQVRNAAETTRDAERPSDSKPYPSHSARGGKVSTGRALLFALAFFGFIGAIVSISNGTRSTSSSRESSASTSEKQVAAPRLPFFPLTEISPPQAALLRGMIEFAQAGDEARLARARAAIDKYPRPLRSNDKELLKQARAKNTEGTKLLAVSNPLQAAQSYFDGFKLDPADVELVDNLGYALLKLQEFDESRKASETALMLAPARTTAWNNLASAFAALSKPEEAAAAFQNAWRFSRARGKTLSTWLETAETDPNPAIQHATDLAYTKIAERRIAAPFRSVLGKLRGNGVPIYLPTALNSIAATDGSRLALFALDNQSFPVGFAQNGYSVMLSLTPDCDANFCLVGSIEAKRGAAEQLTQDQELIVVSDRVAAIWIEEYVRGKSAIAAHLDGVNYVIALASDRQTLIQAAKSMLIAAPILPSPRRLVSGIPQQISNALNAGSVLSDSAKEAAAALPSAAPAPSQSARLPEEIPPIGIGNTLGKNQIRYCVAESIRIEAHQKMINSFSHSSVSAFNRIVNDYNARCSNYRYRVGLLEAARAETESVRNFVEMEGTQRALSNP